MRKEVRVKNAYRSFYSDPNYFYPNYFNYFDIPGVNISATY